MPIPSIPVTRVYGYFRYPDGSSVLGTIRLTLTHILADPTDDLFVVPSEYADEVNLIFTADVPSTDDPDWSTPNWRYTLTEDFEAGRTYEIYAPYGGTNPGTPIGNNSFFQKAALSLRTITGTYLDFAGNPVSGSITFAMVGNYASTTGVNIFVPKPITATLDANGSFSVSLYSTDTVTSGITYVVAENFTNGRTYSIGLTKQNLSTIDIQTLAPKYATPPSTFSPLWASHAFDQQELTTTLETQYQTFGTAVPAQSTAITVNGSAVTAATGTAYATISPIIDERLMPMLVNGA